VTTSTSSAAAAELEAFRSPGQRFPRVARLRSSREIGAVVRGGERLPGRVVNLFFAPSPAGRPRVAIVVPKHGHKVVARNLVRRRLREAVRRDGLPAALASRAAVDIVLFAKPAAYQASYEALRDAVVDSMERACAS
jgi:ribonuclease P protein component